MDWEAISATIREQKLSKEQGLKLIEDARKSVEAAAEKAYEERRQLQEKELKKLREELQALQMKEREAESMIESRPNSVVELHDTREMPEVGTLDSARDGVEEKLTTEEPLTHSEQDKRMADAPIEISMPKEQKREEEVASPRNNRGLVMENEYKDSQASDVRSQSNSEGNEEDDRCPSHPSNATRKGKRIPRRLKTRRRKKPRVHKMGWSIRMNKGKADRYPNRPRSKAAFKCRKNVHRTRNGRKMTRRRLRGKQRKKTRAHEMGAPKKKMKPELRQRASKLREKCARGGRRRKQAGRREAWELRKRRKK